MKRVILVIAALLLVSVDSWAVEGKKYDTNSVIITRYLEKDMFDANSIPYMQPMITTVNAVSNSRFYQQAYVPTKVDKPYFRFSIQGMVGFVRDDQREYSPELPTEKQNLLTAGLKYVRFNSSTGKFEVVDTVGLAVTVVKRLFQKGLESGAVVIPKRAATIFGSLKTTVDIKPDSLIKILGTDPEFATLYNAMDSASKSRIVNAVAGLPGYLTLPPGQNINTVFAAVPQLELGSWHGTEMLLRYIPPVRWDTSIGKFSFYGIAIKHSLSQYFNDPLFHCAIQVGYQGTDLTNTVGVTQAQLKATANFFDVNLHISKEIKGVCEVFSGLDYASVSINSTYSYRLPQELQISLGLLEVDTTSEGVKYVKPPDPSRGYPGDNVIQESKSHFTDQTFKWTIGLYREFGPVAVFADYSISKFNLFTGGLLYRF